ncbi:MFS transporter [Chloroflexota bacterium]
MSTEVSTKKRKGIYPGWWMVIAGGIMCFWGYGIHLYSFGNYVKTLIADFGWTRAQVSLAYSFGRLEGGLEGPFGGMATDKWGPRAVNLTGFILLGIGLCSMYFVNSLWMFYVVWIIASTGANLGLGGPLDAALANWFIKRRGFTIAIMRSVIALSGPIIVPGTMLLLLLFGWRDAFLITGIGTLCIGVPLTWFFIKPRRPEYYGWLPDGKRIDEEIAADTEATIQAGVEYAAAEEEVEFTVRQALKTRTWWICVVAMAFRGMVTPALNLHTVPYILDMGIDPMVAAAAMGTMVFMTAPGRLLFGWLGDRVKKNRIRYLVMLAHSIQALGVFIFTRATSMVGIWVYLVVFGIGNGASIMIWPPLRGRYWGRKAYSTIQGAMQPFSMIAGVIAPVYAGWVYDTTGSYSSAFNMILVFVIIAVVIMFFATPPKPPKKVSHITDVV